MDRLKQEYLSSVLSETFQMISDLQNQTVEEWGLFDSGDLKKSIRKHFTYQPFDDGGAISVRILNYARFLDMKNPNRQLKREGYHLYNRIVFGVLYNRTLPALKYGFTDELRNNVMNALRESGKSIEDGAKRAFAMDLKSNFFEK
ncbi:MAG: hypothetical protein N4A59_16400 [Marinifilum sp.]|jgi:hypothetical protein|nr:hypothetical protein [Marinifilum sp.]